MKIVMKILLVISSTIAIAGFAVMVFGTIRFGPQVGVFGAVAFLLSGCWVGYAVLTLDERKRRGPR